MLAWIDVSVSAPVYLTPGIGLRSKIMCNSDDLRREQLYSGHKHQFAYPKSKRSEYGVFLRASKPLCARTLPCGLPTVTFQSWMVPYECVRH